MRRIKDAMLRKTFFLLALLFSFSVLADDFADVRAEILEAPASIRPGETFAFTASVTNLGPAPARDVMVTTQILDHFCAHNENIGTLQPGEQRIFQCSMVLPVKEYFHYVIYGAVVARSETTEDLTYDNNYAARRADLITLPDVKTQIYSPWPLTPGVPFTADVMYANIARVGAEDVILTITVPEKFGKVPEFCTVEGNRARCAVGALPATDYAEWKRFSIEIYAPDISEHEFEISVESEIPSGDAGPSNDRHVWRARTYRTFYASEGVESLAEAIHAANAACTDLYPCLVAFRIPERVSWTLKEPLPAILGSRITIDGNGQVELLGHELESGFGIVMPSACAASIRGLTLRGFRSAAIAVGSGASPQCPAPSHQKVRFIENNVVTDNMVGLHVDGTGWLIRSNVIERSARAGVRVESGGNRLLNNAIRDNGASGVFIAARASGTDVDDSEIARNGHAGIAIAADAKNVAINGNSIFGNRGIGIDWGIDGPSDTPLTVPEITNAYFVDGVTVIEGNMRMTPGTYAPRLQFYAGDQPGDAQVFLGHQDVNVEHFRFTYAGDLRGKWVTATKTRINYYGWAREPRPDADTGYSLTTTSEFGNAFLVTPD